MPPLPLLTTPPFRPEYRKPVFGVYTIDKMISLTMGSTQGLAFPGDPENNTGPDNQKTDDSFKTVFDQ